MKTENQERIYRALLTYGFFSMMYTIFVYLLSPGEEVDYMYWIANGISAILGATFWFKSKGIFKQKSIRRDEGDIW